MAKVIGYILLFITVFIVGESAGAWNKDDPRAMSCLEIFNPDEKYSKEKCCSEINPPQGMKDCIDEHGDKPSCELTTCIMNKVDIIDGDKIKEDKAADYYDKMMAKETENSQSMISRVKDKCLNKKYMDYPPGESCPPLQLQTCTVLNVIAACKDWKVTDKCNKLKHHVENCTTLLDE